MKKKNFIFTNRVHSKKGIMAIILGVISCIAIVLTIYFTYISGEAANLNYGLALFVALVFSVLGLVLALISRVEKDLFYFFSYIGMIINVIAILVITILLYTGMKGI